MRSARRDELFGRRRFDVRSGRGGETRLLAKTAWRDGIAGNEMYVAS